MNVNATGPTISRVTGLSLSIRAISVEWKLPNDRAT